MENTAHQTNHNYESRSDVKVVRAAGHEPIEAREVREGETVWHPGHKLDVIRDGSAGILPRFRSSKTGALFANHPLMMLGRKQAR